MEEKIKVVILAAGEGTRMKSSTPKVLHKAAGRSLVDWVVQAAKSVCKTPVVVYGSGGDAVPSALGESCEYALQSERKGSGHAVMAAADLIRGSEYTAVLAGDMPLIRPESIERMVKAAQEGEYAAYLLTGYLQDPTGYGRIKRNADGAIMGIVEQKDASEQEKEIQEVNLSLYCFQTEALLEALDEVKPSNAQGEYYLTDCIEILGKKGRKTGGEIIADMSECEGVNNRAQLAAAAGVLRERINHQHMLNGVSMIDPASTYIDAKVQIGRDTLLYPGVVLEGETVIGQGCTLYQGSRIVDSRIEDGAEVTNSVVLQSVVGECSKVGPYAYLRPNTVVGDHCRVGDFVEMKNATLGNRSKVSHLTYVGDSDVGEDVNIGCGVVFVNYNGKEKFRSRVEDRAFIGCNTNLISPVNVGKDSYIAAGATVTKDVPADSLLIARAREVIKEGWGKGRYTVKKK